MNSQKAHELLLKYYSPGGRFSYFPPPSAWNKEGHLEDSLRSLQNSSSLYYDLYAHIPFCFKLCTFCGCNIKLTDDREVVETYKNQMIEQMNSFHSVLGIRQLENAFIGGGTPNYLAPRELSELFKVLLKNRSPRFWGTIEIDPRYLLEDHVEVLKKFNFKTVSLGQQDVNQNVLKEVNRPQELHILERAIERVKKADLEVNVDLIIGLPAQGVDPFLAGLEYLMNLPIDRLSIYPLAHVPWQRSNQLAYGQYSLPTPAIRTNLRLSSHEHLLNNKFIHLGMGHYAREGSLLATQKKNRQLFRTISGFAPSASPDFIGIGASAISKVGNDFFQNHRHFDSFVAGTVEKSVERSHHQLPDEGAFEKFCHDLICHGQVDFPEQHLHWQDSLAPFIEDQIIEVKGRTLKLLPYGDLFFKYILGAIAKTF